MEGYKVKEALKYLLKKNSKTYQDLSEELDVSLSTVKRMLTAESLSIEKLGKILSWLNVNLSDLQLIIDSLSSKRVMFTEKQEQFLSKDIRYYNYLDKIIQGMTPDQIKQKYNLSDKKNQKYLIDLENQGLIYVTNNGEVKSKYLTTWSHHGPIKKHLVKKVNERMNGYFLNKQLSNEFDETTFKLGYNIIWMPQNTYMKFIEELEKVRVKYMAHADMERKANIDDLGVCYLGLSYDFLNGGELPKSYSNSSFDLYEEIS